MESAPCPPSPGNSWGGCGGGLNTGDVFARYRPVAERLAHGLMIEPPENFQR